MFFGGGFGGKPSSGYNGGKGRNSEGLRNGAKQTRQLLSELPDDVAMLGAKKFPNKSSRYLWIVRYIRPSELKVSGSKTRLIDEITRITRTAKHAGWRVGVVDCGGREEEFCGKGHRRGYKWTTFEGLGGETELDLGDGSNRRLGDEKLKEVLKGRIPEGTVVDVNRVSKLKRVAGKEGGITAVLLTDKYDVPGAWVKISYKDREMGTFVVARGKNLEMGKEFGVKKYPVVVVIRGMGEGKEWEVLGKKEGKDGIEEWLVNTMEEKGGEKGGGGRNKKRRRVR
ncbi:hypothetical protein TrCOL_g2546 [Triparma columacea]|uniref:Uncharacterized protein n=1 Tax=Triparma columacea TaxID=722753 RepID=A0A9W7GJD4_9STRA|nr:hypothetical protein TrCOL_g2546 [Triparma columacea]